MRKFFILCALCASTLTGSAAYQGALGGKFTINAQGDQVFFSKGNLQYRASTKIWRFATHQYDTIGAGNSKISASYDGWIDLFGWGTGNNPTNTSIKGSNYSFTDWGTNPISNGGNEPDAWRTLTNDEWNYLFNSRKNADSLFALGSVNGVNGTILLPDDWTLPEGVPSFTFSTTHGLEDKGNYYDNENGSNFSDNTYTTEEWEIMEAAGAVFLPAAGYRNFDPNVGAVVVGAVGSTGDYWSATFFDTSNAYHLIFHSNYLYPPYTDTRSYGFSVRLVQDVPNVPTAIDQTGSSSLQGGDRGRLILVNGMLLIERNGNIFNTLGIKIK